MKQARVRKPKSFSSQISNGFFYLIYILVNIFIKIGESTRNILNIPVLVIRAAIASISQGTSTVLSSIGKVFSFSQKTSEESTKVVTPEVRAKKGRGRPRKRVSLLTRVSTVIGGIARIIFSPIRLSVRGVKKISYSIIGLLSVFRRKEHTDDTKNYRYRGKQAKTRPFFLSNKLSYLFLGSFLTLCALFIYQSYIFAKNLPSPYSIGKVNYPLSTHMYDRKGRLLYEIYRDQNRTPVNLDDLPAYVSQASIAIEDKDFYRHKGISLVSGILRASREIVFNKNLQGGSTITQQLVKTSLLTPERTLQRKIKEIILALWTERIYTKKQILGMYLNQVPYGGQAYGIEEASKTYFGKHAKDLTVSEAALLAGLPQAPSIYSPYVNPKLALNRRDDVLRNMYEQGYIDKATEEKAMKTKLEVTPLQTNINAPHFVFYVKSELEKQYGIREVEEGGLRVVTTLDLNIQREAEKILKEEIAKVSYLNVTNGAILVTKAQTGEILAMVGSVDYYAKPSGAFNVTTGLRQPGSSVKPFTYALALEKGFTSASTIDDSPTVFGIAGSEAYRPVNYDGRFHGRVTMRTALANSYNIPAVKTLNAVGVADYAEFAKRLGISTWGDSSRYGLSMTLGGLEVKMLDMNTAFGVFANQGYRVDINNIIKMENAKGEELFVLDPYKTKVLDEGIAYIMSDMLSDNAARVPAFGTQSFLEIPGYKVAVKTGTTDEKKDNWTCGYTTEFITCVWVGNNDNIPMNPYLASGITGAAPIWNRTMQYLLKNYSENKNKWFDKPANIVERSCYGKTEYFIAGTENSVPCRDTAPQISITPSRQTDERKDNRFQRFQ